jgi:phage terminase small subunit
MTTKLTPKQQRFVQEYLKDLNATQAAIRAGYSARNADKIGPELLGKTRVAQAIQEAQAKLAAKLEATVERIVGEYAKIAFLDPRKFFATDGSLKPIVELDADVAAALASFEQDEHWKGTADDGHEVTTKRIRFADKLRGLDALAKHLGIFKGMQESQQVSNNYFLALIQVAQERGMQSTLGREKYVREHITDSEIVSESRNGHGRDGKNNAS